ncbi:MAG: sigma-70 family RNA polymerase sigma factor [Ruminococcus flavefaciens]|nr:sigma-70 family RNA polymerase sigma factor [Ruminococcus flavefaciens]MCM1229774.1 sigma-70 family RNA polymerase sigma factor [Ruminococcus flavefaciens]
MESELKQPLAEENLGLVHLCANRFRGRGIEYEDLYSAGCLGLLKAVKAFDSGRGVKFSTYAVPVILGEIKRLFRDGGSVHVSRSLKDLSMKLQKICSGFAQLNGREPTISELAEITGESEADIAEALCASQPLISLTASDDDGQLDVPVEAPDENIVDMLALRQIMCGLSEDDRMLIELRYFRNLTQSKTAQILGTTQVQVSRREKKLLAYMRKELLC